MVVTQRYQPNALLRQIWLFTLSQCSTSRFHLVNGRPSDNQTGFVSNGDNTDTANRASV